MKSGSPTKSEASPLTNCSPFSFEIGKTYETQSGEMVTVIGRTELKGHECLECSDERYRYDRSNDKSDAGRVTGTRHDYSCPQNFKRANAKSEIPVHAATPCSAVWLPAGQPPEGDRGRWSRKVIVLMMSGDALPLKYFRDDKTEEGRWQRPTGMHAGDMPLWWIDLPNDLAQTRRAGD